MATFETSEFKYEPSHYVPFRDKAVLEKMRDITREDFVNHPNKNLNITFIKESEVGVMYLMDMYTRIRNAMLAGEKLVMILPQPWPFYARLAELINITKLDCRNLYTFNMDEYANEKGEIAPESWPYGFTHALKKYFYNELDSNLRPPENQMVGLTSENFKDYGKMISDLGGADICYSGPGWTGHIAFVEPDAPEVPKDLEEFKKMGPSLVTLSPFTLAQNSLHGSFGAAGDIAAVPSKAATIGPAQFLESKERIGAYFIGVHGTATSWQKLTARLALFGPVTPLVPDSMIQLVPSQVWISENIANKIEVDWDKGY